ncbi:TetR/AcrR family transcriptional regulator [Paenibacillus sp. NPDC058071]|uniref:TetR/AcrR family transcriptional regulator n=1 Tax=Paenibacillus sp. NPDC058071 TaxID=3346326 RepID=UPI0036D96886
MSPRAGIDLPIIVQAAAELADERGLQEVTLASLAQKLGVRSPSLYNHIDGLGGLRIKLAIHGLKIMREQLLRAAAGRSGEEAALALGRAYIEFALARPGLYEAALAPHQQEDGELKEVSDELLELLLRIVEAYDLERQTAIHLARGLRSLLHGFASLKSKGGFGLPYDLTDSIDTALRAYLAGIRNQYSNSKSS